MRHDQSATPSVCSGILSDSFPHPSVEHHRATRIFGGEELDDVDLASMMVAKCLQGRTSSTAVHREQILVKGTSIHVYTMSIRDPKFFAPVRQGFQWNTMRPEVQ